MALLTGEKHENLCVQEPRNNYVFTALVPRTLYSAAFLSTQKVSLEDCVCVLQCEWELDRNYRPCFPWQKAILGYDASPLKARISSFQGHWNERTEFAHVCAVVQNPIWINPVTWVVCVQYLYTKEKPAYKVTTAGRRTQHPEHENRQEVIGKQSL